VIVPCWSVRQICAPTTSSSASAFGLGCPKGLGWPKTAYYPPRETSRPFTVTSVTDRFPAAARAGLASPTAGPRKSRNPTFVTHDRRPRTQADGPEPSSSMKRKDARVGATSLVGIGVHVAQLWVSLGAWTRATPPPGEGTSPPWAGRRRARSPCPSRRPSPLHGRSRSGGACVSGLTGRARFCSLATSPRSMGSKICEDNSGERQEDDRDRLACGRTTP
jgi:hypothetical protein